MDCRISVYRKGWGLIIWLNPERLMHATQNAQSCLHLVDFRLNSTQADDRWGSGWGSGPTIQRVKPFCSSSHFQNQTWNACSNYLVLVFSLQINSSLGLILMHSLDAISTQAIFFNYWEGTCEQKLKYHSERHPDFPDTAFVPILGFTRSRFSVIPHPQTHHGLHHQPEKFAIDTTATPTAHVDHSQKNSEPQRLPASLCLPIFLSIPGADPRPLPPLAQKKGNKVHKNEI